MKRMMAITALMTLPALAACGQQGGNANATAEDINRLGAVEQNVAIEPENQMMTVDAAGNAAAESEPSAPAVRNTVEPARKASPVPRPERPAPRPKAPPPPVDPHAGMDMGNMANMSH